MRNLQYVPVTTVLDYSSPPTRFGGLDISSTEFCHVDRALGFFVFYVAFTNPSEVRLCQTSPYERDLYKISNGAAVGLAERSSYVLNSYDTSYNKPTKNACGRL